VSLESIVTCYGAYKTPGGKLIAVEFDIEDGVLRHVVVTGDFFLYPEEALGALAGALEGMPATASEQEFAARLEAALSGGVELLGSSPEALAKAVVRALAAEEPGASAGGA
jgi:lipoate-protein ligase A